MEQSLFIEWVKKWFPSITLRIVEKLNDTKNPLTYLHKTMLRKEFSLSGKWEALSATYTLVAADIVAMDSSLPLKKRDYKGKASGDIPKMGMELTLNEQQLTELNTLVAVGGMDTQILAKLFADSSRCIGGIYERNEAMLLEGLSTGVTLVEDAENVGTGIRLDYGYLSANKFGVAVLWSNVNATPFDDIERVLAQARLNGHVITKVMLDKYALDNLSKTNQAKELYAFQQGFVGATIPVPDKDQINRLASQRYGFTFEIVERSVRTEKNGTQTVSKPWAEGQVVFLTSEQVGSLVWARLAEQIYPVQNVSYQTIEEYILVSKYRTNRPSLREYTSSQARVVPVISGVDAIYTLDSKALQA